MNIKLARTRTVMKHPMFGRAPTLKSFPPALRPSGLQFHSLAEGRRLIAKQPEKAYQSANEGSSVTGDACSMSHFIPSGLPGCHQGPTCHATRILPCSEIVGRGGGRSDHAEDPSPRLLLHCSNRAATLPTTQPAYRITQTINLSLLPIFSHFPAILSRSL